MFPLRYLWIGTLVVLYGLSTGSAAAQTVILVSPQGDDSADGSPQHPLKTLHGAQRRVRDVLAAGGPRWARVEIAAGDYFLDKPLAFTPSDSGESPEHTVTYAAAGGEVRVSGGRRISGWRQAGDHWVAKMPATNEPDALPPPRDLWVNGRRAIRARSPNAEFFRIEQAGPDNRTSFVVREADLLTVAHPRTVEVALLHDWSISRIRLASIDAPSRTYHFDDPIGGDMAQFAISNFEPNPRYFVENAPELLDAPGEWYFDETSGELRYLPRDGETHELAEVIAPHTEQLVMIRGAGEKPVEHLCFEGLTFSHTRFQTPPHGYAGIQASWYERRAQPGDHTGVTMTSAVRLDLARGCRFTHCRFEHLAACGLQATRSRDVHVDRSMFRDIGGGALMIGSDGANDSPRTEDNAIENCLIEDCGVTFFGAVGLWIGFASDTTVRNNELRQLPYSGISVGWQWNDSPTVCHGHDIRLNHIHHVMQTLSDGGGIYTLGRQPGTVLAGNVIHDVPINAGRAESNGIFMDEGSTEITVAENTIYNVARSPIRFHRAGKNTLTKNRLVAPPGVPFFQYHSASPNDMTFIDNQEIAAAAWQPPPGDAGAERAGPQSER